MMVEKRVNIDAKLQCFDWVCQRRQATVMVVDLACAAL